MIKISFIKYSAVIAFALISINVTGQAINRKALTERNNPHITQFDSLASLSVGNGNFAYTVDAAGLQTFPELYAKGVPLGTQSQWGWHSFPNTEHYKHEEALKNYNFRGKEEPYSVQFKEPGRQQDAANYLRANAHRLHLGYVGLELTKKDGSKIAPNDIKGINQTLNLWDGLITSNYTIEGNTVAVQTAVHPDKEQIAVALNSALIKTGQLKINFRFPYPTGNHTDDATNWAKPDKHKTEIISQDGHSFVLKRTLDDTVYYVTVQYTGKAAISKRSALFYTLPAKR